MRLVDIANAREGMKVAKPVTDTAGNLLLKEGTELSQRWIDILRARKVLDVYVEEEGDDLSALSEEQREELRRKADEDVDRAFRGFESNALMQQIAASAKRYLRSRIK